MTGIEAKLANAAAIEQYGMVMKSKGLRARAAWAFGQAAKLRGESAAIGATEMKQAA